MIAAEGASPEIAGSFSGYRWSDLQEENVSKQNNPRLRKERRKDSEKSGANAHGYGSAIRRATADERE
jgi:hypothetical protein